MCEAPAYFVTGYSVHGRPAPFIQGRAQWTMYEARRGGRLSRRQTVAAGPERQGR